MIQSSVAAVDSRIDDGAVVAARPPGIFSPPEDARWRLEGSLLEAISPAFRAGLMSHARGLEHDNAPKSAFVSKLETFARLDDADLAALAEIELSAEAVGPNQPIVVEGQTRNWVFPLLSGLAYGHKDFRDGRRQIITLLLPGDICGGHGHLLRRAYCGVRSLTPARVGRLSAERFLELLEFHPNIAIALHRASLVDESVLHAWIVNLGQRRAHERLAHLFCEFAHRMDRLGLRRADGGFELPLTQQDLGCVLGLTSVHVNRVLQRLRAESLIEFVNGAVHIRDMGRLSAVAGFDAGYLSP